MPPHHYALAMFGAVALWWVWPVIVLMRKHKSDHKLHWTASVMLQLTGLAILFGGFLFGFQGIIAGTLFPPSLPIVVYSLWQEANTLAMPLTQVFVVSIFTVTLVLVLIIAIARANKCSALHYSVFIAGGIAIVAGIWATDVIAQKQISTHHSEIGATCLTSKPIWQSVRDEHKWHKRPHAQARLDDEILYWSYRQRDFVHAFKLHNPMPADWCPGQ